MGTNYLGFRVFCLQTRTAVLKGFQTHETHTKTHNSRSVVHVPRSSELAVDVDLKPPWVVGFHLRDFRVSPPSVLELNNANPTHKRKQRKQTCVCVVCVFSRCTDFSTVHTVPVDNPAQCVPQTVFFTIPRSFDVRVDNPAQLVCVLQ